MSFELCAIGALFCDLNRFEDPPFLTITSTTSSESIAYDNLHTFTCVSWVFVHEFYVFLDGRFRFKPASKPASHS